MLVQRADVLQALETLQEECTKKQASLALHAQSIVSALAAAGAHAPPVQLLPGVSAPSTAAGTAVSSAAVSAARAPAAGVPAAAAVAPSGGVLAPLPVAARGVVLAAAYEKCKVWQHNHYF
jgi:hypothetical protein